MANLKDTKRRIVSVKSTQKITRAMKLVSSAKYARAQKALNQANVYQNKLDAMVKVAGTPGTEEGTAAGNLLLVIGTDRGLCGALNTNLIKLCESKITSPIKLMLWGRRTHVLGQRPGSEVLESREHVLERPDYAVAAKAATALYEAYTREEIGSAQVAFTKFRNALSQDAQIKSILPECILLAPGDERVLLEPNSDIVRQSLSKRWLAAQIYNAMLNAALSEHAARMTAMDSATNNADEVIKTLTLQYNRARQAAITKELIEITSGAEAL